MNETGIYGTKQIYSWLDNPLQVRVNKIINKRFFTNKINEREKMSKTINEYIAVFDCAEKKLPLIF